VLEKLAEAHKIWVAMALNMGVTPWYVEDLVQEMYIRLSKYVDNPDKIFYKDTGQINRFYIWVTLRNMWISYQTSLSRNPFVHLSEDIVEMDWLHSTTEDDQDSYRDALEDIIHRIDDFVDTWDHWYDRKLFKIVFTNDISMRKLARETGISLTSIFNSFKKYKQSIREEFSEDWEDFINSNFDKV